MRTVFSLVTALCLAACSGRVADAPGDGSGLSQGSPCQADSVRPCDVGLAEQRCDSDGTWGACAPITGCTAGEVVECNTSSGEAGVAQCVNDSQGTSYTDCGVVEGCMPGESQRCFPAGSPWGDLSAGCALEAGQWHIPSGACNTPLVLAFSAAPVAFTDAPGHFDVVGRGASTSSAWVSAETPWLVLDRDGDGAVRDGRELFGSMTSLADGRRAAQGFAALAPLDADGDGWITARDPAFADLRLWSDRDQDRASTPGELETLAQRGVLGLALAFHVSPRCQAGSCEMEQARLRFVDAQGEEREGRVSDVHLAPR